MKMENFAEYNYTYGMGANEYSYFPNNYNTFKR